MMIKESGINPIKLMSETSSPSWGVSEIREREIESRYHQNVHCHHTLFQHEHRMPKSGITQILIHTYLINVLLSLLCCLD